MGWEQRGSHQYYYRKERYSTQVKSIYVGRGEFAELTATLDAMQRNSRSVERVKQKQVLLACDSLDTHMDATEQLILTLTEAVLITAGFHQHKRQWRKRRQ